MTGGFVALTRAVPHSMEWCELTHIERAPIDLDRARLEHAAYEEVLTSLGGNIVRVTDAHDMPDSVFVEDTAIILPEVAILARPGAVSRRREVDGIEGVLAERMRIRRIESPATLDGGDVIVHGRTIWAGRSARTNEAGIAALRSVSEEYGYTVHARSFGGCLHYKSGVSVAADDVIVVNQAWIPLGSAPLISENMRVIDVHPDEPFAANVLRIGETVIVADHAPRTRELLEASGVRTVAVRMSELAKAEAGVTCCSLILRP